MLAEMGFELPPLGTEQISMVKGEWMRSRGGAEENREICVPGTCDKFSGVYLSISIQ